MEGQVYPEGVDDVDRLFSRLERVAPPDDLRGRVVAGAQERARRRRLLGYSLLVASILLAGAVSFAIGQQLRLSGALTLVTFLADLELLTEAPVEIGLAFLELVPWHLALIVAASLVAVVVSVRLALTPSIRFGARAADR
jgi:hypothetical protein